MIDTERGIVNEEHAEIPNGYIRRASDVLSPDEKFWEVFEPGFNPVVAISREQMAAIIPMGKEDEWEEVCNILDLVSGETKRDILSFETLGIDRIGNIGAIEAHVFPTAYNLAEEADITQKWDLALAAMLHDTKEDCQLGDMQEFLKMLFKLGQRNPIAVTVAFSLSKASRKYMPDKKERHEEYEEHLANCDLNKEYLSARLAKQRFFSNDDYGKTAKQFAWDKIFKDADEESFMKGTNLKDMQLIVKLSERFNSHLGDYIAANPGLRCSSLSTSDIEKSKNYAKESYGLLNKIIEKQPNIIERSSMLKVWVQRLEKVVTLLNPELLSTQNVSTESVKNNSEFQEI